MLRSFTRGLPTLGRLSVPKLQTSEGFAVRYFGVAEPEALVKAKQAGALVVDLRDSTERASQAVCEAAMHVEWDREKSELALDQLPKDKSVPIILH